jgi:hypothetical protein
MLRDMGASKEDGLQKQKWWRVFWVCITSFELDFVHDRKSWMDLLEEGFNQVVPDLFGGQCSRIISHFGIPSD